MKNNLETQWDTMLLIIPNNLDSLIWQLCFYRFSTATCPPSNFLTCDLCAVSVNILRCLLRYWYTAGCLPSSSILTWLAFAVTRGSVLISLEVLSWGVGSVELGFPASERLWRLCERAQLGMPCCTPLKITFSSSALSRPPPRWLSLMSKPVMRFTPVHTIPDSVLLEFTVWRSPCTSAGFPWDHAGVRC